MKKRNYYELSLKYFKKLLKYNKKLTEEEWDKFAQKNGLFSAFTLKAKDDVNTFEQLKEKQSKWF